MLQGEPGGHSGPLWSAHELLFYLFSKVWRSIIWYEGSLAGMVDHYGQLMNFNKNYTWEVDQNIVS